MNAPSTHLFNTNLSAEAGARELSIAVSVLAIAILAYGSRVTWLEEVC